jgi:hypothetical protein
MPSAPQRQGTVSPISIFIKGSSGSHHTIIPSPPEICKLGINLQAWFADT